MTETVLATLCPYVILAAPLGTRPPARTTPEGDDLEAACVELDPRAVDPEISEPEDLPRSYLL